MFRRIATAGAIAIAALGLGLVHTGSARAATYTVCGVGVVVPVPGGGNCMTLPDAIAAAQTTPEADTIRMLPGLYCPIDLEGSMQQPIKFVGVGIAGLSGNVTLNGPEAGLTTISDALPCDPASSLVNVNVHVTSNAPIVFQNLTVDGGAGGSRGFSQVGVAANTVLRDDIFQNFPAPFGTGIYFTSGFVGNQNTSLDVENSAILNNGVGVEFNGALASLYDSTVAGNGYGVELVNYIVSLGSDTISGNTVGVDANCCGNSLQVVDSLVAGNTQDCGATADWESGPPSSFGNLVGSYSCPTLGTGDGRDTSLTPPNVAAPALNGGPTPSVAPPTQAQGFDSPSCGLFGVDQREFLNPLSTSCDAGAVQSGGVGVPAAATADLDLGAVAPNVNAGGIVSLGVTGGDLVGVSGVSISGAGWSVTNDGCTYALLEKAFGAGCSVAVSVDPTSVGSWNGTLTIHTTAGDETAHLFAHVPHAPVFSSFAPMHGPVGTSVTISGFHFTGATAVAFNGTPAASFTVDNDNSITATVAAGTTTGAVTITGPGGIATSLHNFTVVVPPPVVSGFSPQHGVIGTTVTVNGSNFTGATGVSFNGTPAVTFSVVTNTQMTAVVPAGATTGHVVVTGPGGVGSSLGVFTVLPKITSFTPTSGAHGTHVTIHGSGFTGATTVVFHGKSALFTVVNDTTISATVPVGATTGHLFVTTPGGTATSAGLFTIP